jgi:hypothetical protein
MAPSTVTANPYRTGEGHRFDNRKQVYIQIRLLDNFGPGTPYWAGTRSGVSRLGMPRWAGTRPRVWKVEMWDGALGRLFLGLWAWDNKYLC